MENLSPFFNTLEWVVKNTWPMLALFIAIICVVRISSSIINHEKFVFYKDFYSLLAIIYFLLLYYLLLSTEKAASGVNLTPFKEMTRYRVGSTLFVYNVIGNIALFIPYGYFISDTIKAKKVHHILIPALITSLTAEIIQYKIGRAFDVDDVILNVAGAIIGLLIYISIQKIKDKLPPFLKNNIFYNILAIIVLIIIVCCIGKSFAIGWM